MFDGSVIELTPEGAGKGSSAKRHNPHLAAMFESMDEGVGMIMKKLDDLGLTQDTILVFASESRTLGRRSTFPNPSLPRKRNCSTS